VPSLSSLDSTVTEITYDEETDTVYGSFWPLKAPVLNCWVSDYEYLRIELATRLPVGTLVEELTTAAAGNSRYLELAANSNKLFEPSESGRRLLTPQLKLNVVHRAVTLATRTYDRQHGIQSSGSRQLSWMERELQYSDNVPYLVEVAPEQRDPLPREELVIDEFAHSLRLIEQQTQKGRDRYFDRLLQYWYTQPSGPIKRSTGQVLLEFVQSNRLDRCNMRGIREHREKFLLRAIKAS
jgi:hypothetical protein